MKLADRLGTLLAWAIGGIGVGVLCGASSVLFLDLLERATRLRLGEPRLVWLLPVAGYLLGRVYEDWGAGVRAGNDLVIDTLFGAGPRIPLRMAPLVLLGTVWTHLFGGSAGREGTAVQMGAALADDFAHRLGFTPERRLELVAAGVAGGFGAVFGTPFAGTVFALELVVIGHARYDALVPAMIAALVGDLTTRSLGALHTHYPTVGALELTPVVLFKWVVFAAGVALVATAFIELTHGVKQVLEARVPRLAWRLVAGGLAVVGLRLLAGTDAYLGLGVPGIVQAFTDPDLPAWSFAAKLGFTAVTIGSGFVGGEVTPLFFVGAQLGNALGGLLALPRELAAGVGMAALFGAASNAPLALAIMAVEVLGAAVLPHVLVVSVLAWCLSGPRSIYGAQRLHRTKAGTRLDGPVAVRELRRKGAS